MSANSSSPRRKFTRTCSNFATQRLTLNIPSNQTIKYRLECICRVLSVDSLPDFRKAQRWRLVLEALSRLFTDFKRNTLHDFGWPACIGYSITVKRAVKKWRRHFSKDKLRSQDKRWLQKAVRGFCGLKYWNLEQLVFEEALSARNYGTVGLGVDEPVYSLLRPSSPAKRNRYVSFIGFGESRTRTIKSALFLVPMADEQDYARDWNR